MSDYRDFAAYRQAEIANRKARRERAQDARDRAASLEATKAQIKAARGHDGTPAEPEYKPESEWSTSERQIYAARGIKPTVIESGWWGDEDD